MARWAVRGPRGQWCCLAWLAAAGCGGAGVPPVTDPGLPQAPVPELSPAQLQSGVQVDRYRQQLEAIAGRRPPGSSHWQAVQRRCDRTLHDLGFSVELHDYGTGINVIGTRAGTLAPEQRVVLGAHYDHIPGCEGADDNASGVAGILEAARVLRETNHDRTLVVACWDEEEWGLVGSRAWAARARQRQRDIIVYFNFDAIAFTDARPDTQRVPPGFETLFSEPIDRLRQQQWRADFITVVADSRAEPWARHLAEAAEREQLPYALLAIPDWLRMSHLAVDLERSDHASLWGQGYPAIMITDTAEFRSDTYHCRGRPDTLATLDVPFATKVVAATVYAAAVALRADPVESSPP